MRKVVLFAVGLVIGLDILFTYACCKSAAKADRIGELER